MFSIKCFNNILSQMAIVPTLSECLLNIYLQIFAQKDGSEQ